MLYRGMSLLLGALVGSIFCPEASLGMTRFYPQTGIRSRHLFSDVPACCPQPGKRRKILFPTDLQMFNCFTPIQTQENPLALCLERLKLLLEYQVNGSVAGAEKETVDMQSYSSQHRSLLRSTIRLFPESYSLLMEDALQAAITSFAEDVKARVECVVETWVAEGLIPSIHWADTLEEPAKKEAEDNFLRQLVKLIAEASAAIDAKAAAKEPSH
jgi:hypothetical protein